MINRRFGLAGLGLVSLGQLGLGQRGGPQATNDTVSAPIDHVVYDVTFDRRTAASRTVGIRMSFTTDGSSPVLLSLPAWTPGAYELGNFARWVIGFSASSGDKPVAWD